MPNCTQHSSNGNGQVCLKDMYDSLANVSFHIPILLTPIPTSRQASTLYTETSLLGSLSGAPPIAGAPTIQPIESATPSVAPAITPDADSIGQLGGVGDNNFNMDRQEFSETG